MEPLTILCMLLWWNNFDLCLLGSNVLKFWSEYYTEPFLLKCMCTWSNFRYSLFLLFFLFRSVSPAIKRFVPFKTWKIVWYENGSINSVVLWKHYFEIQICKRIWIWKYSKTYVQLLIRFIWEFNCVICDNADSNCCGVKREDLKNILFF